MEDMWAKKVEIPDFTGTDPVGWLARAERFFGEHEIPSSDKLQWAFMSMEGEAMLWFHSWCQEYPDSESEWESFSIAMIRRFGERDDDRGVALDREDAKLKTTIHTTQLKAKENQEKLVVLLSKNVENVNVVETSMVKAEHMEGKERSSGQIFGKMKRTVAPMTGRSGGDGIDFSDSSLLSSKPSNSKLYLAAAMETQSACCSAMAPPPPKPPDFSSLTTDPLQSKSTVEGPLATPNRSLLISSPVIIEESVLSKAEERGAQLVFHKLSPIVEIWDLAIGKVHLAQNPVAPTPPPEPPDAGVVPLPELPCARQLATTIRLLLMGSPLISLDMGSLLAGAKFRGDLEEKLKAVLKEVTASLVREMEGLILMEEKDIGANMVLGKWCPILDLMGLAQFEHYIWIHEERVVGSLIQGQMVLGLFQDTSSPNLDLGGFAEVSIIPTLADPIIHPDVLHTTITQLDRAVLTTITKLAALNSGKRMQGLFTSNFEVSLLFCFWKGQISGSIVNGALLFLTPLVEHLYQCVLAAIVLSAVMGQGATVYRNARHYPEAYTYHGIVIVYINAPICYIKDKLQDYDEVVIINSGLEVERNLLGAALMFPLKFPVKSLGPIQDKEKVVESQAQMSMERTILNCELKKSELELLGMYCFMTKSATENRVFDPGGSSLVTCAAWSFYFRPCDTGRSCFQLLQDHFPIQARQLLIQWEHSPAEAATWANEIYLESQYTMLRLEDKSVFQEGGNVRTQLSSDMGSNRQPTRPKVWRVYTRRGKGNVSAEVAKVVALILGFFIYMS